MMWFRMGNPATVEIKIDEPFPHLRHAPIVEAIIDLRVSASQALVESTLRSCLEARLPEYSYLDSQREFQQELLVEAGRPPSPSVRDWGWKGLRFRSQDQKHIAQFNRDGFVFSRLEPYDTWEQLVEEGLRLWAIYREEAAPSEIHRIGVRFINRILMPPAELRFEDYVQPAPQPPAGLDVPFLTFMHQDMLAVPGQDYLINVIRTIQPPTVLSGAGYGVILDIDVFTKANLDLAETQLGARLEDMRWLKNKAFFGSITMKALERMR